MTLKCYVIPVDDNGYAFFAVKALTNPYRSTQTPYAAGCPSVFGGNVDDDATVSATLVQEAMEESHNKVLINRTALDLAMSGRARGVALQEIHKESVGENEMTFYLLRNGFEVRTAPSPAVPAGNNAYKETTGYILKVDLNRMPSNVSAQQVAAAMIDAMPANLQRQIPSGARKQFETSGSAEAVRRAMTLVRMGKLIQNA